MKPTGTPIARALRIWFVVEVFFGVGAVLTIALSPTETRTSFAWDVQPPVMAAVLGAYYISTALLFVLPLFARRWEMIRVMILPTALFSLAELITTFLHLDRFLVGTLAFYTWFLSYLLPPPIFIGYYLWQERRAKQLGTSRPTEPLPADARTALIQWGSLLLATALLLFIFPDWLIGAAPWKMTPLTARALLSWFIGLAALMLSIARENDRTQALIAAPALLLVFPTVTLQIARFAGQVDFANVALFVGYGFMLIAFALGVSLVRGRWREVFR
jgi:hypothetical protein